jgi:multidrug efflux pump subunit AcrA (membrane-fusion protein)
MRNQQIIIDSLKEDLAKAVVTAEVSGTVTAVFAQEGAMSSGQLFVIEDTANLRVATSIKEYDIGTVSEGMPVTIKTDGTGDEEFTGTLSKIYPTAAKDPTGAVLDTTNVEFPAEVKVNSGSKLRIGMNARLSIVTEAKENVITVPFEAIGSGADGATFVFIMADGAEGTKIAKKVPVTPGMETDFYSEVLDSELKAGDEVISTAEGIEDGMTVFVAPVAGEAPTDAAGGGSLQVQFG